MIIKKALVFLSFFCLTQLKAQDIFEKFRLTEKALNGPLFLEPEEVIKLLRKHDELFGKINRTNPDSASVYYPRLLVTKCLAGTVRMVYTKNALNRYTLQLLNWSKLYNNQIYYIKGLLYRAVYTNSEDFHKTIRLTKLASQLSIRYGNKELIVEVAISDIFYTKSFASNNEVIALIELYSPYLSTVNGQKLIPFLVLSGWAYMAKNQYAESHKYLNKALDLCLQEKDSTTLVSVYYPLSVLHTRISEPLEALEYSQKALQLFKTTGPLTNQISTTMEFEILHALSLSYYTLESWDSADLYINRVIKDRQELKDSSNMMMAIHTKSLIQIKKNNYNKALNLLLQYAKHFKAHDLHDLYYPSFQAISMCYRELGKYELALFYSQKALEYYMEQKALSSVIAIQNDIASVYEKMGDYKKALHFKNLLHLNKDSLAKRKKYKELAKQETEFNVKITEYEKEQYRLKAEKKEAVNKKNKTILRKDASIKRFLVASIFGGASIGSLIISILIIRNRSKRRQIALKNITIKHQETNEKVLKDKLSLLKKKLIVENQSDSGAEEVPLGKSLEGNSSYLAKKIKEDNNWRDFMMGFNATYFGFVDNIHLHFPDLTNNEIKILAMVKLKLTINDMSQLLMVTDAGITKAKSRIRDKLGLKKALEIPAFIDRFIEKHCKSSESSTTK